MAGRNIEGESSGNPQHQRPTALEILTHHPGKEPVHNEVAESEKNAQIEFNRDAMRDEMLSLAVGYEHSFVSLGEEAEAKSKLESDEAEAGSKSDNTRSIKNLFRRKGRGGNEQKEGKGFTENPKYPYVVGYHREMQGVNPDYYMQDFTPDGEEIRIDSSLKVELIDGQISALEYTSDIRIEYWLEKEGLLGYNGYRSKKDSDRKIKEENERIEELEGKLPIINELKREITTTDQSGKDFKYTNDFCGITIKLQLHDDDGVLLDSPVLQVEDGWEGEGKAGQYVYDFQENKFELQKDTLSVYGEKMDDMQLRFQPFAESIDASPVDIMEQMLNLIPATRG